MSGHLTAHTARYKLLNLETQVQKWELQVRFVMDKLLMKQVFSKFFVSCCAVHHCTFAPYSLTTVP